ncbi:glycosyltransferase family 2 protein [Leptolyngbya sp. BC1307]|uniref:glycosyltransferase n=1 Tax=Leptolyngbya sp. BC1307 TaxID=2029589 RepID=UPI000EFB0FFC|nr:glycosyltransferase family 2 protein [Leptolyngbya sp. BC1307]
MSDFAEPDVSELDLESDLAFEVELFKGYAGRRLKAAIALVTLWVITALLHSVAWGHGLGLLFAGLLSIQALRVMFAKPLAVPQQLPSSQTDDSVQLTAQELSEWPYVSLLVAAKNEERVIGKLIESLLHIDYPAARYDLWIIDDYSTDQTPQILDDLARRYPRLQVVHRGPEAVGGKSGALNLVWPKTQADILAVFDADAHVPGDLLRHVVPLFDPALGYAKVGAVQVRKAIANVRTNFWTRGQKAEMALDSYMQERRIAVGGIGELRGNGQFVRRSALAQCGGWNEETITDDLDLTIQLHLQQWDIGLLFTPAVEEEGVTSALSLWHQRNRWAEGGFQRYLDYWRQLAQNRLGWRKSIDMASFWVIQYMMPAVALPDVAIALARHRLPIFGPVTALTVAMSGIGMFTTLRRAEQTSIFSAAIQTVRGTLYMLHWVLVIATMAMRISVRPKRLKWVKTIHGDS